MIDFSKYRQNSAMGWLALVLKIAAIVIILALIVNAVRFAFHLEPNHLQKDQWTWVDEVIMSYHKGEVSLFEALTWEFGILAHSHILTLATFMLNEQFFGFDLRVDTAIGMVSLIAAFMVVCIYTVRRTALPIDTSSQLRPALLQKDIWLWGLLLLTASAFFNIAVVNAYNWSLVVFEHLYLFLALGYLYLFSKMILSGSIYKLAGLMTLMILFGDAMGTAAVLTSFVMTVLLIAVDRRHAKSFLILIIVFVVTVILGKLLLTGKRVHGSGSVLEVLTYGADNPGNVYAFFTKGLGRGFFSFHGHYKIGETKAIEWTGWIGLAGIVFCTAMALVALFRKRLVENVFPILLIGFSLVCVLGAIKLRLMTGVATFMYGDRYYRFLIPFMLGGFYLLYDFWAAKPSAIVTGVFAAFVGLHVYITYSSSDFVWNKAAGSIENYYNNWDVTLGEYARYESDDYPEVNNQCRRSFCRESVDFLYGRNTLQNIDNPDIP